MTNPGARVLIVGGAGFIGGHFSGALLADERTTRLSSKSRVRTSSGLAFLACRKRASGSGTATLGLDDPLLIELYPVAECVSSVQMAGSSEYVRA